MAKSEIQKHEELLKKYSKMYPPGTHETVPTGSIVLDYMFGGGFPIGKIILFSASPGLGKSLVSLFMCRQVLKSDKEGIVVYIDAETGVVEDLQKAVLQEDFGKRFVLISPHTYEDVEDVIAQYAKTGKLKMVIIDSITSIFPKAVLDGDSNKIGSKSGAESLFCLKMKVHTTLSKFGIVYVNQVRANIQMHGGGRGPATKSAGGWPLHFYNDVHINMRPKFYLYNAKKEKLGACVEITCEKNKLVGNRSAYAFLKYGYGVSNIATMTQILKHATLAVQSGSYFKIEIPDVDLGDGVGKGVSVQGNAGLDNLIKDNFDVINEYIRKSGILKDFFENFKL